MAFPTIYIGSAANGGAVTNSGSTDSATPTVSGTGTASVSGTTVTFTGSPDLSGVLADGSQTIYIAGATNTNMNVFKITAVDNTAKTVTVAVAPTGTLSGVNWAIGGRQILPNTSIESAITAGWTVVINDSLTMSAAFTSRTSGTAADGPIRFRGANPASRPTLTNNTSGVTFAFSAGVEWIISDLIFDNTVNSAAAVNTVNNSVYINCKFTKTGGTAAPAISQAGANHTCWFIACEVTGPNVTDGASTLSGGHWYHSYIHDVSGDGMEIVQNNASLTVINCVIESCGARGIFVSASGSTLLSPVVVIGSTIYGCGNSGIEITDIDVRPILINNVILQNGDAAGEYNVEIPSAEIWGCHRNNNIYHSDSAKNYSSAFTPHSSDITTDPALTDAAGANFQPGSSSPALAAALAIPTLTHYLDIGAIQRNVTGGGGSSLSGVI